MKWIFHLLYKILTHKNKQSLNTASSFNCERDDDADSVQSFSSTASMCSSVSQCDHAHFARNGTTYSGRSKRYVVHCSPYSADTDDYLTPTQRTNRTIRKLRNLLKEAQAELIEKDKEILRLRKEVVELRLLKVDSGAESNEGNGDEAPGLPSQGDLPQTDRQTPATSPHLGYCSSPFLAQSLSDSGHFEDLNSSKDISHAAQNHTSQIKTLESLQHQYEDEIRELKERHNDKVESLLQRITDVNDRYYALRPLYEDCKERLHELEKQNEELKSNNMCKIHIKKISELEILNEELSQDKQNLQFEIDELRLAKADLELIRLSHDKLKVENEQHKNRLDELVETLCHLEEDKANVKEDESISNRDCVLTEAYSQTDVQSLVPSSEACCQIDGVQSLVPSSEACCQTDDVQSLVPSSEDSSHDSCEKNKQCAYKVENAELKLQIVAHIEQIKQLEQKESNEKDIYVKLYQKGIQAAKLQDTEELENGQNQETEVSLIPDLLQRLRIKQEELDNIKAMYRRLLETRKQQPKHDPEMTLQFLKSAFYYFLTHRENAQENLAAIGSILGFTDNEKINIERAFLWR
ncbi:protein quick-to-court isoform X2 [Homalodisca vitripennis]|uniref:protein quick-to-court isoform X2 n=1 Tax=Homalodisca vitripennis TaxID=197043 RepID=UPI001EECCF2E|nr:protein quick-to-court isoform X2 [Homalodisca vitripennis]